MPYSVYQHWDPLKVCVVGRSYPPEFYSWIKVPHVRSLFERIAIETEEDYQTIIRLLESFGVQVLRPDIDEEVTFEDGRYKMPPMTPRDTMIMIGDTFYANYGHDFQRFYNVVKDPAWPDCRTLREFYQLPKIIQDECLEKFSLKDHLSNNYTKIFKHIEDQGNIIKYSSDTSIQHGTYINGAMTTRMGRDLYFGTWDPSDDIVDLQRRMDLEFPQTRNHIIKTGGHGDGTYCPVCPGLIISLEDVPTFADTFPGWEVLYLKGQGYAQVAPFMHLKSKNFGRWWIPGFEYDDQVTDVVETWLTDWVGYVEETVFDVNMLIVDPKNVIVFNENERVFEAFKRYGITPHVVTFRHRYFWDGGIHCITTDLDRSGTMQDFFPQRG
jgi:hypothetical protein